MQIKVNDKEFNIDVEYSEKDKFFLLKAKNSNFQMGHVSFQLKKDKTIWIYKIVTNKMFYHQGVATALIYAMEYFAYNFNVKTIEGKFYPTNEFAKPFYEKLGYEIYKEDYDTCLYKDLDYNFIVNNIKPNIRFEDEEKKNINEIIF